MSRRMYRHSRRPASRIVQGESRSLRMMTQSRTRLILVLACFGFSFTVLSLRLLEVSLMKSDVASLHSLVTHPQMMTELSEEETNRTMGEAQDEVRQRLDIVDRNGLVVATNIQTAALVANPQLILNPDEVAHHLADILHLPEDMLREKLGRNSSYVYLKRTLTPDDQAQVNALGVPGLFFEPQDKRIYPFGSLAAHVVGYVDVDSRGLSGIERGMQQQLTHPIPDSKPLALSLDMRVQSLVHEELAGAMQHFSAVGGAAVVMNVHTGEVVSMVSLPDYDPHQPGTASADARFNRVTLGSYEMGSSFKTFTLAMALDNGIVGLQDSYDAAHPIHMAGYTIHDAHPYPRRLSVPEIYAYSSNIGTVQIAMDVGREKQKKFMQRLGMLEPLSTEIPERSQPIYPSDWSQLASMTISFGHGISVSPLHLVRGIATMVGDGKLVQPTFLKVNAATQHARAKKSNKIIGEQTAKTIRQMMRAVVQYGTAKKANVKGYAVGGKTGTAEKIVHGRYDANAKICSFVGVFPADAPEYVVFAMLDEPKGTKETYGFATGGWIAAPVVANIISRMGPVLGMQPVDGSGDEALEQLWQRATGQYLQARQRPAIPAGAIQNAAYTTH